MSFRVGIEDLVFHVKEETPSLGQNYMYNLLKAVQILDGKRLEDVIKTCPHCSTCFANLTGHKKVYCSRRCAMLANVKKKKSQNPELERRRQNIRTHDSLLRQQGRPDKERRSLLCAYIKKREYMPWEIPDYIADFLEPERNEGETRKKEENQKT